MRTTPVSLVGVAAMLALLIGCRDAPTQPEVPQAVAIGAHAIDGSHCAAAHDMTAMFQSLADGCAGIANGFQDARPATSYEAKSVTPLRDWSRHVWATYEFRYLGKRAFGMRLVRVQFYTPPSSGNLLPTVVGEFPMLLATELAGSKYIGISGGCNDATLAKVYDGSVVASSATEEQCWKASLSDYAHIEVRFCLDNKGGPNAGVYDRADHEHLCPAGAVDPSYPDDPFQFPSINQLPTAVLDVGEYITAGVDGRASVTLDGSESLDLEDGKGSTAMTYAWTITPSANLPPIPQGVRASVNLPLGTYVARLALTDSKGGFDVATKTFSVVPASTIDFSGSTQVRWPSSGLWEATFTTPLPNTSIRWLRGRVGQALIEDGTGPTYHGAADGWDFTLRAELLDESGAVLDSEERTIDDVTPVSTVSISGALRAKPNYTCTWTAVVDGDVPPASYTWRRNGVDVQNDAAQYRASTGTSSFSLTVLVRDVLGRDSETASHSVAVSTVYGICPSADD